MNIGFYVSGRATRLLHILQRNDSEINNSIKLVVSDEENAILEGKLDNSNINYCCYSKEDYKDNIYFSNLLLEEMKKNKIDYLFVFGKKLLKGDILIQYHNKMINFHPSILPLFSGFNAIDRALEAHMTILGNTAHFIDNSIDNGPIILQNIISTDIFYKEGYEGVLKYQEDMFFTIYNLLKEKRITIENKKVIIKQSNSENCFYIPKV